MSASAIVFPGAKSVPAWPAGLWRADELAGGEAAVLPTGLPALDAVLPGGGWPLGSLVEVLQPGPQAPVWRLLAPALAEAVAREVGPVVLVGPPHAAFAPGLAARGLPASRLLWVRAEAPAARLWAAEQALRCAEVAAVLAWLPARGVQSADLRRLQLAAQRHQRLLFALRPEAVRGQASPARLRVCLQTGAPSGLRSSLLQPGSCRVHPAPGEEALAVEVLKRRGPPLQAPVLLPLAHAPLARWLQSRPGGPSISSPPEFPHGLDRAAALA